MMREKSEFKIFIFIAYCLLFFALNLATSQLNQLNAQSILYDTERQCQISTSSRCPYDMLFIDENTSSGSLSGKCHPIKSRFCEYFTGSSNVIFDGDKVYCSGNVNPSIGTCTAEGSNFRLNGSTDSQKVSNLPPSFRADLQPILESILPQNTSRSIVNDTDVRTYLEEYNNSILSNLASNQNVQCKLFDNQMKIEIPKYYVFRARTEASGNQIIDSDNIGLYTSSYALSSIKQAYNLGLTLDLDRMNADVSFCKDEDSVYLYTSSSHFLYRESNAICIDGVNRFNQNVGCVATLIDGQEQLCFEGFTDNFYANISNEIHAYAVVDIPAGILDAISDGFGDNAIVASNYGGRSARPDDDYLRFNLASDTFKCKKTSLDLFNESGFKGCSAYTSYGPDQEVMINAGQEDTYNDCVRCLYGNNGLFSNVNPDEFDIARGNVPLAGQPIRPDNEPFAEPIQGRIFTDLGCIGTQDTASVVNTILRLALGVMGGIVIVRIMQGVALMQRGDPESIQEGQQIIFSAIVGLITLVMSVVILSFLGINVLNIEGIENLNINS